MAHSHQMASAVTELIPLAKLLMGKAVEAQGRIRSEESRGDWPLRVTGLGAGKGGSDPSFSSCPLVRDWTSRTHPPASFLKITCHQNGQITALLSRV